jgi:hypothetical protein
LAKDKEIIYLRGKLFWTKVLGEPVLNYNKDGHIWTFDLALDKDGLKQAKQHKELNIKDKDDERGSFITVKQKYERTDKDGNVKYNDPIKVLDAAGKKWDGETKIGNETLADVKLEIRNWGPGKYPSVYPRAIRILDHKEYQAQEFAPLAEDDEYYKQTAAEDEQFQKDFGSREDIDDDFPE